MKEKAKAAEDIPSFAVLEWPSRRRDACPAARRPRRTEGARPRGGPQVPASCPKRWDTASGSQGRGTAALREDRTPTPVEELTRAAGGHRTPALPAGGEPLLESGMRSTPASLFGLPRGAGAALAAWPTQRPICRTVRAINSLPKVVFGRTVFLLYAVRVSNPFRDGFQILIPSFKKIFSLRSHLL